MVTMELLREIFDYDPETGVVTRKIARGNRKANASVGHYRGGYLRVKIGKRLYELHRVIWLWISCS